MGKSLMEEQCEANAKLIAAAPEMMESLDETRAALEWAFEHLRDLFSDEDLLGLAEARAVHARAMAALKKAGVLP